MFNFNLQEMLIRIPALIIAFTVHELVHGLTAYLLGDSTAKEDGRLSLNPLRHLDPLGFIFILFFRFGWAKPVMVNLGNLKNPKWDYALISVAGPLSNLLLAFIGTLIFVPLITNIGIIPMGGFWANFVYGFIHINIVLLVFNMLPIPPLDGSKFFSVWLPEQMYHAFHTSFARVGFLILMIFMFAGITGNIIGPMIETIISALLNLAVNIYGAFN
ncbi:MAG: site-2 protease family protein [Firmicutes bacterium]|nr:site-2 protease family protein [Bacillota bacterium]